MGNIKLAYSTFGLTRLSIIDAIHAVADAGYPGIELAFHRSHFNPFEITDASLKEIKMALKMRNLVPACISSPTYFFLNERPHEPSLMSVDLAGRKQRINLVQRAIKVAQYLGAPVVCFGSGFMREEHLDHPTVNPRDLLIASINECLHDIHDVTLVIEPEPGMYIETIADGIHLVEEINHEQFKLHLDLNHLACGDANYLQEMIKAIPYVRYLHISDALEGYNLKMIDQSKEASVNLDLANYLIYDPQRADYYLLDRQHTVYFYDKPLSSAEKLAFSKKMQLMGQRAQVQYVDYQKLAHNESPYDAEINVYGYSIAHMSFYAIDRAKPILRYLREQGIANKILANTVTGIAHFHELPGKGLVDFMGCFKQLVDKGYSGYGSVELYHHINDWQQALVNSFNYLTPLLP